MPYSTDVADLVELVIRSTQLLLALDLSNDQQVGASSKGVIIGPWN